MALFAGKRNFYISVAIFLAVTLPVIITGFLRYQELDRDMTQLAVTRRQALAHLASNQIEASFDNIIDLGVFFSRNAEFQQFIAAGKWDKAIQLLGNPIEDFPWMDNIALFNPEGTMLASIMPLTTIGQNFSFRDYYKGVSKNWQPYISE
ncbi:MAG: hypothetical protein HYW69_00835, partial [Candidatus Nealsonbacteria bacterium]|nr:hypothetical protein [Candidatus Nealsonbacteria bacterium]